MKIEFKPKYEEYNKKIKKGNVLTIKRGIVALAGPITNFIVVLVTMIEMQLNKDLQTSQLCITIIYSNLLIGIFNLIPIYPLDGGRLIKEVLHITVGLQKSYQYTYQISKVTIILLTAIASIIILYIQNISIIIILIYLWGIELTERRRYYAMKRIYQHMSEKCEMTK